MGADNSWEVVEFWIPFRFWFFMQSNPGFGFEISLGLETRKMSVNSGGPPFITQSTYKQNDHQMAFYLKICASS